MKIVVRDDKGKPLGAIKINVVDLDAREQKAQNKILWQRVTNQLVTRFAGRQKPPVPKKRAAKASRSVSPSATKSIEIRIVLPSLSGLPLKKAVNKFKLLTKRRRRLIGASCLLVIVLVIAASLALVRSSQNPKVTASAPPGSTRPKLVRGNPPYASLLPAGKTAVALGGWARVSPPGHAPVYAYIDHINKVQINVSEQPLPANFRSDPASEVGKLADSYNAGDKFTAANTTVYVATDSNGEQQVIVNLNKLLILIASSSALTNNQWAAYISSLH